MSTPALQLQSVTKRFGDVVALRDVSIEVGDDELLVVLGPTRAGKTTLLRTIAGLEVPEHGQVRMQGSDVTRTEPAERDVALVFQNFSIYPNKSVRENLAFPLRAPGRNLSRQQVEAKVNHAAELLQITALLDRRSDRLSGGQMQRVAIGRAIVREPRLFLMDEPLTNLDAKLRETLRVELVLLRRRLKRPMVYVTHDQAEAMSMADRIAVLSGGSVLQTGTPQNLYDKPDSPEVAKLLGEPAINLLIRGGKTIGIRPEHVKLVEPGAPGTIEARIELVEHAGPVTMLALTTSDGSSLRTLVARSIRLDPGDPVAVRFERVIEW